MKIDRVNKVVQLYFLIRNDVVYFTARIYLWEDLPIVQE